MNFPIYIKAKILLMLVTSKIEYLHVTGRTESKRKTNDKRYVLCLHMLRQHAAHIHSFYSYYSQINIPNIFCAVCSNFYTARFYSDEKLTFEDLNICMVAVGKLFQR